MEHEQVDKVYQHIPLYVTCQMWNLKIRKYFVDTSVAVNIILVQTSKL